MIRRLTVSLSGLAIAAGVVLVAQPVLAQKKPDSSRQQTAAGTASSSSAAVPDKATAYYHYTMGHLYGELAATYGNRGEYLNKAIDHYRQALKADPNSSYVAEELGDLYLQSNRLREGAADAEEALKQNPNDLGARRILGRIYTRLIGDAAQGTVNRDMLRRAIEQFQEIGKRSPKEADTWLMLGRLHRISQESAESEKAYRKALEIEPANEDALTGLAMVYLDVGDNNRASEMLAKVAEKNPSLRNLTMLASSYEQLRDYSNAAKILQRALEMQPENKEIRRALAQDLLLSDKLDEALKLFQEMAAADPRDAQLQLRLSQIYMQKRDFAKAREAGRKAKELDSENLDILYNEVSLLEAEGKSAEAIDTLKSMLATGQKRSYNAEEKNTRAILLERLAVLYRNADQPKNSVDTFRQVVELDPARGPRAAAQIVETYRLAKDFKSAADEAEAGVKKYPNDRLLATLRASLLADLGKGDLAVSAARKMIEGKADRESYISLAQIYEKTKNYPEMAKAIEEAAKLSTTTDEKITVYFLRGAMLEKQKKFEQAEAEFRKVLEIDPTNASALNYLGYMFADRNIRLQEAQQMVGKALEQDPNNGAYLDSLGWVYYRLDRLKEAEEVLQRALEKYSRDPTVHDHLGDVYFKQGRIKEAIQQWQVSLKEWETAAAGEQDPAEVARVQKKLEGAKVRLAKEGAPSKQP